MVEHATENRGVPSSTLGLGTTSPTSFSVAPGRHSLAPIAFVLLVIAALAALSCGGGSAKPFPAEATLAPGQHVAPPGSDVAVTFVGVEGDSRCPTDATCVRAGEATVHLTVVAGGASSNLDITVPRESEAAATAGQITVTVLELRPLPTSNQPIAAGDYRVRIRVERS